MALLITEQDNTINIFDNFYSQSLTVNAAEWDNVNSYFLGVLKGDSGSVKTKQTASQFATVLFRISQETGTDIQIFMDYFRANVETTLQVNTEMAFYLNLLKSKTALYGVSNVPTPNQAVQRNVIP